MKLRTNLRCLNKEFNDFLLAVGEYKIKNLIIPDQWKTNNVCLKIFKNTNIENNENKVILACHNSDVKKLNIKVLKLLNTNGKIYYSIDYATHKCVDQTKDDIYLNFLIRISFFGRAKRSSITKFCIFCLQLKKFNPIIEFIIYISSLLVNPKDHCCKF